MQFFRRALPAVIATVGLGLATSASGALVLHWNLDEGTGSTAADSSGNGHDGAYQTPGPAPAWTTTGGAAGGYASFSGGNTDESFRSASFPTVTGTVFSPWTISGWIRPTGTANDTWGVLRTGVGNSYYSAKVQSGTARLTGRNTTDRTLNSGVLVNDGNWHHVVAVFRSEDLREIFVDGASQGTSTINVPFLNPNGFAIGALDRTATSIVDEYAGDIDDVQVYSDALDTSQVTFLFNNAGTAIPEPSSAALVALATCGVALRRRRR